ncbi:MAG: GvpL/GvpF family gas vesicle protein [Gaiellaceae bacterium]
MIELYAITCHPAPPLPPVAPLSEVTADGLAAVCAPHVERDASPRTMWHHEAVVEALMEDRDILPVRYGTRLADESAVARVLDERREDLVEALERVRDAVELSVRVRDRSVDASDPLATVRGHEVHDRLSRLARASARRRGSVPREVVRGAYLVERDSVAPFVEEVARLDEAHDELSLLCTGPWPPYTFVER